MDGASSFYTRAVEKLRVYEYAKCGTCRKALAWLDRRGIAYEAIPITTDPPSKTLLKRVVREAKIPLRKLFNTSGQSYREGKFGERLATMTEDEALSALAADGKLIKRPLVLGPDGLVLVGFREEDYVAAFG